MGGNSPSVVKMDSEMPNTPQTIDGPLASLRQWTRPRKRPNHPCELCGVELAVEHDHVLDLKERQLACACMACTILFSDGNARYKRVRRRAEMLQKFQLSDTGWDSLLIPIELAFFFHSTTAGRPIAMYPSPAGPTESLLELTAWKDLVGENPTLGELAPDVEALLVNRVGEAREYYLVSIDRCYELVGLIRLHWRGLSGGTEVWKHITSFFDDLKRATGSGT
jgi:Family of unknown function (DUF5947)